MAAWTRARAAVAIRRALTGAPAGPDRLAALDALDWLEERLAHVERELRAEDTTARVETQTPRQAGRDADVAHRGPRRGVP